MDKFEEQVQRQALWQKSRKDLSWPEKVRQAEAIRDAIKALRKTKTNSPQTGDRSTLNDPTPTGIRD